MKNIILLTLLYLLVSSPINAEIILDKDVMPIRCLHCNRTMEWKNTGRYWCQDNHPVTGELWHTNKEYCIVDGAGCPYWNYVCPNCKSEDRKSAPFIGKL